MKKFIYIAFIAATVSACSNNRNPGRVYMPDMAYSKALESYAQRDSTIYTSNPNNKGSLIYYNGAPVPGTIKRGELFPYTLANDSLGYVQSAAVKNPVAELNKEEMEETGRLYNINCGVCHDAKGTGQGPLAGKVPGVANLTGDVYKAMTDGTMFHSITYGKNNMGSYASQLDRKQRWQMVKYIRSLQGGTAAAKTDTAAKATTAAAAAKDTTTKP